MPDAPPITPGAAWASPRAVLRDARAMLRPPPRMRLSEWIERHVYLPEGVSALPGRVRLWPYQPEIADAIGDPNLERVTLVKGVRIGFTFLLTGAVASFVANDPSPIIVLQPTADDCFDAETEVLTDAGWRRFAELSGVERLATVNLDSDALELQCPTRLIAKDYVGEMIRLHSRRVDVLVTPGHRMVAYARRGWGEQRTGITGQPPRIVRADHLTTEHRLKLTATTWVGDGRRAIEIPASRRPDGMEIEPGRVVNSGDLAEFVGWYVAEGCRRAIPCGRRLRSGRRASIARRVELTQNVGDKHARICALLDRLPWRWSEAPAGHGDRSRRFLITSKQLFEFLADCGDTCYAKRVPGWVRAAPADVIARFIDAMVMGDGWAIAGKRRHIATVSCALANELQELFLKLGRSASVIRRRRQGYRIMGRGGADTVDQFYVKELQATRGAMNARRDGAGSRTLLTRRVQYAGKVYCATVPNGTLVVRRNGKMLVAGNCRDYVVSDLEPTFAASRVVQGCLSDDTDEGERNTLSSRRFPGGSLKVVAAKAPRNLRRHTARVLLIDEADAMQPGLEGAPIDLAEKRTLSFPDRKIVLGSTPLLEETSNVLRSYALSDRRVYEVPCPACGTFTEVLWSHIEWEPDRPETAAFRCPSCRVLVPERQKPEMVRAGRWRAMAPEVVGHAGFRLNALVSLLANATWPKLATEFLKVRQDTDQLQTFINTILAQGWRDEGDEVDPDTLRERAEDFSLDALPPEVLVITAGTDVQHDRLETTLIGWSRTEPYVLGHVYAWGPPQDPQVGVWDELDTLLCRQRWAHPLGGSLGVDAAIVDSGDATDHVYAFCFPRLRRRIWAGKGIAGQRQAFQLSQSKVKRHGDLGMSGRLVLVGVDTLKAALFDRLERGAGFHVSTSLEPSWFDQLASERKVIRYHRGQPIRSFERIKARAAEALDCTIYAWAARHGLQGIDWDGREQTLQQAGGGQAAGVPEGTARPGVIRSNWMSRYRGGV